MTRKSPQQRVVKKRGMSFVDTAMLALDAVMIVQMTASLSHAVETYNEEHPNGPRLNIWLTDGENPYVIAGQNLLHTFVGVSEPEEISIGCYNFRTGKKLCEIDRFKAKIRPSSSFKTEVLYASLPASLKVGTVAHLRGKAKLNSGDVVIDDSPPFIIGDHRSVQVDTLVS